MGTASSGCGNFNGGCGTGVDACIDMAGDLVKYLKTIPFDPKDGSVDNTQYTIARDSNGIVTVKACGAEGTPISASR